MKIKAEACPHGYWTHSARVSGSPINRCPWCYGFDNSNRDAVPVIGHGNGWLLRQGQTPCTSCGGPAEAGWGGRLTNEPTPPPQRCYSCACGDNTKEAIAKRETHTLKRGVKKLRGAK
jgi:hypothetical protein